MQGGYGINMGIVMHSRILLFKALSCVRVVIKESMAFIVAEEHGTTGKWCQWHYVFAGTKNQGWA